VSPNYNDHFDASLEIGEKAFSSLIHDTIPVWPDMYEILYAYQSGRNEEIVSAINELKKNNSTLNPDELYKIHEKFFSDDKLLDISEDIGSKINEEIRNIISAMTAAGEKSDACDTALRKIETKFASVTTADQLHGIVEILGNITRTMADNNQNLSSRLQQSTQQINTLHQDLEKARNESNTDALTGLANRKKFDSELRNFLETIQEGSVGICLLMVDIDHFKNFNDTYGHQTGDQILRLVAQTLKNGVKGRDLPARYGGEEFGIILPDTSSKDAFTVAEQIREVIAAKELIKRSTNENLGRLTVSIGIAQSTADDKPANLIERADKALYKAKETGRNRCIIAPAT
jgi:diguanylate cyclase